MIGVFYARKTKPLIEYERRKEKSISTMITRIIQYKGLNNRRVYYLCNLKKRDCRKSDKSGIYKSIEKLNSSIVDWSFIATAARGNKSYLPGDIDGTYLGSILSSGLYRHALVDVTASKDTP